MAGTDAKRKPTKGEAYMYVNLLWLAVGVFVFIPILNNFIIQLVILATDGNVFYGSLPETLSVIRDVLGAAGNYIGLGVLAVCLINFGRNAFGVTVAAFASHGITFCASMLAYSVFADDIMTAFFVLGVDTVFNILVYCVIYLVIMYIAKKKDTLLNVPPYSLGIFNSRHPLSLAFILTSAVYCVISLLVVLYTMIGDFLDPSLGPPVTLADKLHWVTQYLTPVISSLIGYFVMLFIGEYAERLKK